LHRHTEATVQTNDAISLEDLGNAVTQTRELALVRTFADIGGQPVTVSTSTCKPNFLLQPNLPLFTAVCSNLLYENTLQNELVQSHMSPDAKHHATYCPGLEEIPPMHGLHDTSLSEQDALHYVGATHT
jgi:hypothetical protein